MGFPLSSRTTEVTAAASPVTISGQNWYLGSKLVASTGNAATLRVYNGNGGELIGACNAPGDGGDEHMPHWPRKVDDPAYRNIIYVVVAGTGAVAVIHHSED